MFKKFFNWITGIFSRLSAFIKTNSDNRKIEREAKREERRIAEMQRQAKLEKERKERAAELDRLRAEQEARVAAEKAAYNAKIKTPDGMRDELTKMIDKRINSLNGISNNLNHTASKLSWIDVPSYVKPNEDGTRQADYNRINLMSELRGIETRISQSKSDINSQIDGLYSIKNLVNKILDIKFTPASTEPSPEAND